MIKLLCFDIDGTVVAGFDQIHPEVISELQRVQNHGVKVCLATGRASFSAYPVAERLAIHQPSMFFSGSLIQNPKTREIVSSLPLDRAVLRRLIEDLRKQGFYTELYTESDYRVEEVIEFTNIHKPYLRCEPLIGSFEQVIEQHDILKLVCMVEVGQRDRELRELLSGYPEIYAGISIGHAHPHILYFNLTDRRASREAAFDFFLKYYGVTADEVAAFGDAESDIPFLTLAGVGVALGNASQMVKDVADVVAGPVSGPGVAPILRQLCP